ncbi:MAG TPA: hypothetical protein VK465_18020 [Fibrobacteria bacterium]|nr:hypothetical protein [Fibrobacteria bacterium]
MTEKPARQEIDELVRRLRSSHFHLADIREAGEILASVHTPAEAYQLALDFAMSDHEQVRTLGLVIMEDIAPRLDAARGFLSGARDAARLLVREEPKPPGPDYTVIGEVIKVWLRDSREKRGRG